MELKQFKEKLQDVVNGKVVDGISTKFTKEERTFLESEYKSRTGHHMPSNCGSCVYPYKILLNWINIDESKEVVAPKKKAK